jgi:large subunit ribosomal protein L29
MKAVELRDLTVDELEQREKDLFEELFNLKFRHATAQLENTMSIPRLKKDIARVKTVIREKIKKEEG